ncbi:hypothetical protein CY35_01G185400 [Sphagnum magellanicum]|nr:hypothetical protein CY35_01G185400 [Sphagnum magellanicum]KAH9576862.1 hypothetical protein CY35_01G185400 [Sphagnum magellanicum]KAH9576863.1 hypothetical protein CY35_01G185400 [Sphagnum magellanicum]KAH9576870.1 hypothetical protein CY35_01G185400 [Sphagnum magellanicum]KAH9576871.1 hypothetical protein CY35_01G185400 [Sphagnum magellanicum]
MGNGQTKEEQLYQAVQSGNHGTVKALRREGASLEWVDKEGRTPLILACTRGDLFEMVLTLLTLGANLKAYRPGTHGGMPIHHAAKRGLDKTVRVLLDNGADPLAANDDGMTPLDMARNRGHASVVRMIEDRICLFSGVVRELAGPGFLETLAPQWVTKKIWVVVLPIELDTRRPPRFELVVYQSPKVSLWKGGGSSPGSHAAGFCNVPLPRTIIPLAKAEVEEPKFSSADPVLVVTDKKTKTKYKFLSEQEGEKGQLERLYKACKGVPQATNAVNGQGTPSQAVLQGLSSLNRPMIQQSLPASSQETSAISTPMHQGPSPGKRQMAMELPHDAALKMAIDASIRTASEEGVQLSSGELRDGQDRRRRSSDSKTKMSSDAGKFGGWGGDQKQQSAYNGWSPSKEEAGPSRVQNSPGEQPRRPVPESEVRTQHSPPAHAQAPVSDLPLPALATPPSAPPLPADYKALENSDPGSICYPPIDMTSARGDLSAGHISNEAAAATSSKGGASQCVVCWDAPAEGVCIPCGHMAGCMNCLSEIKAKNWGCPVCRATIQQVIRVYAV